VHLVNYEQTVSEGRGVAALAPGVAESPMFVFGSGQHSDEIETAVLGVNRGFEKRPDGSYVILYGAVAATPDEWGQRYLNGTRCLALAFQVGLNGKHNLD